MSFAFDYNCHDSSLVLSGIKISVAMLVQNNARFMRAFLFKCVISVKVNSKQTAFAATRCISSMQVMCGDAGGILLARAQSSRCHYLCLNRGKHQAKPTNGQRGAVWDQIKLRKAGIYGGKWQLFLVSVEAEGTSVPGPFHKHLVYNAAAVSSQLNC